MLNLLTNIMLSFFFLSSISCIESWAADAGYLGMSLPATFVAFNQTSPWNTPIPSNPAIDPHSSGMIIYLKSMSTGYLLGNYKNWTAPIHVVDYQNAPKVNVFTTQQLYPDIANGVPYVTNIPMPLSVWPDPSSDGHMILVDPYLRTAWEFSRFKKNSDGSYQASTITKWDLDGPGWRQPFLGDYWWTYGATASGMPIIGGIIRPEEIKAGVIKHALEGCVPNTLKTSIPNTQFELCSPLAARNDGTGLDFNYIPEGSRLQLDPKLNLNTLKLSPETKIIAKCLQQYGMYIVDSGADFSIVFQNLGPDGGEWAKYNFFSDLYKIPINKFRVIKCNRVTK